MNHNGLGFTQFFWLILVAFVVALIARRFRVPYALALVVTGLAIGVRRKRVSSANNWRSSREPSRPPRPRRRNKG